MKQTHSLNFTSSPTLVESQENGNKVFEDWEGKKLILYRDGRFFRIKRHDGKEVPWAEGKRWLTEQDFFNHYKSVVESAQQKEESKLPKIKYKKGYERRVDDKYVYIVKVNKDGSEEIVKQLKKKVKDPPNLEWVKEGVEKRKRARKKKRVKQEDAS